MIVCAKNRKIWRKNLSVKVRAGGDFGVDVGRDFEVLSDGKMDSFFLKALMLVAMHFWRSSNSAFIVVT